MIIPESKEKLDELVADINYCLDYGRLMDMPKERLVEMIIGQYRHIKKQK